MDKPNPGHFMQQRRGYFPVPPDDSYQNLRTEMMLRCVVWSSDGQMLASGSADRTIKLRGVKG